MTLPVEKRDHKANRRVHIATRLFAVAFIGTLACFAAVILTPKGSTQDWAALFAFVFVLAGVTTPMMEIDARINKVDIILVGKHLVFQDRCCSIGTKVFCRS